jgi:hypothetical protein
MTAEIVNLRRARKAKARAEAQARADENRAKFGRPKAERELADRSKSHADRQLDAHRREGGDDGLAK